VFGLCLILPCIIFIKTLIQFPSRDSKHREEPYSLARGRDKHDRKASEKYGFEDIVSFALTSSSQDSLSIQNGMSIEIESNDLGKSANHIYAIIPKGLVNLKLP
jgi:hypothetical protein